MAEKKTPMCDELEKVEILTRICNNNSLETIKKIEGLLQAEFIKSMKKKTE